MAGVAQHDIETQAIDMLPVAWSFGLKSVDTSISVVDSMLFAMGSFPARIVDNTLLAVHSFGPQMVHSFGLQMVHSFGGLQMVQSECGIVVAVKLLIVKPHFVLGWIAQKYRSADHKLQSL